MTDKKEPDEIVLAVSVAMTSLANLLRYSTEPNFMDDYEAQCQASKGLQALSKILPELNL